MKKYFAYTRVSTTRQGEQGVSLQQQREAIERYASRCGLDVCDWLEEQETAAKLGRPIFNKMLKRLRLGHAAGVIIHKIDRSARNLKDWADLGQLIDQGVEVHFANEALDLNSRGGRLSADIQAVVASDFIRNLREETKKGIYGRLRQGLSPFPAPLGYLDRGPGKAKSVDPVAGPIVKEAFTLYSTGRFGIHALTDEVNRMGLRTRSGKHVGHNMIARILKKPFYAGVMHIQKTGESFLGVHEPLVSRALFERVQQILLGKRVCGASKHDFLFRRLVRCASCNRSLIAEKQKGHIYYRCHNRKCPSTILREEWIDAAIRCHVDPLRLVPEEEVYLDELVKRKSAEEKQLIESEVNTAQLRLHGLIERQNRLTDAYLDGALDRQDYEQRKTALLLERREVEEKKRAAESGDSSALADLKKMVELTKHAYIQYENGFPDEKRDLVNDIMSNRTASGKSIVVTMLSALSEVANRPKSSSGCPPAFEGRTSEEGTLQEFAQKRGSLDGKCQEFWKRWIDKLCDPEAV